MARDSFDDGKCGQMRTGSDAVRRSGVRSCE